MQQRYSVDQATAHQRPRRASSPGGRRLLSWALTVAAVFLPLLTLFVTARPAAAADPGFFTNPVLPSLDAPRCPAGTYTVPVGTRYVLITADGGAGAAGSTKVMFDGLNPGVGGSGAHVEGIFPVTAGQTLYVVVGRKGAWDAADVSTTYSGWPDGGQNAYNNGGGGGSSFVTTQALYAYTGCQDGTKDTTVTPATVMNLDRSQMLVVAGGGGGGGNAGMAHSGGNGGNAGANHEFKGAAGSDAEHLASDCDYGRAGAGASPTAPGAGGAGGCTGTDGEAGHGFYGGGSPLYGIGPFTLRVGASGAGGGGWYGGGSGGAGSTTFGGGGGGGAGASHVGSDALRPSVGQSGNEPQVHIQPLDTPTTEALTGDGAATLPLAASYATSPAIWFRAQGGWSGGKTYYAVDNPACAPANLGPCTEYHGNTFNVGNGLHTLTYFSIDGWGLEELPHTQAFVVGLPGAGVGTGTNPSATVGGAADTAGSVSVRATGSGTVGTALYNAALPGEVTFNTNSAYVEVIASGADLTGLTITDCKLNGGTYVAWWNGTTWQRASNQSYNAATGCVTVTVNPTGTAPTIGQLTGTVFAAGSAPWISPGSSTRSGWTNQPVQIGFDCSVGAMFTGVTPAAGWIPTNAPVTKGGGITLASDGANQTATATCTDGLGQTATATVTGINIDTTAPTVTYSGNVGTYTVDQTVSIGCTAADATSGLASNTCANIGGPAYAFALGANSYSATATDNAGNGGSGSATFTVTVNAAALNKVIARLVTDPKVAATLQQQASAIAAAPNAGSKANKLDAFISAVNAQTGKSITQANAKILIALARAL